MRRLLLAAAALIALPIVAPPPADAVGPTSNFVFDPWRHWDTTNTPGPVPSGVEMQFGQYGWIVNVILVDATEDTFLFMHRCGTPPDRTQPAAAYAPAGDTTYNLVPIREFDGCMTLYGASDLIIDKVGTSLNSDGADYVAHPDPIELTVPAATAGVTRVVADDEMVPDDAQFVAVWVTITAPDDRHAAISHVNCFTGDDVFTPQRISAPPGHIHGNLMIMPLDDSGRICFTDLNLPAAALTITRWGYLAPGATATPEGLPYSGFVAQRLPGFTALTPERRFDTRTAGLALAAGQTYRHRFDDLPADATAVALNLTVTDTGGPGFVTAHPCEGERPVVSNVNHTGAGLTIPNFAIVPLGPSREICFFTLASTHLIADLAGYFAWDLGDGYVPQQPSRVFDTRISGVPIAAGATYVADLSAYGPSSAAVLNVTVTGPAAPGFVTVHPCDVAAPLVSNLNYLTGQTRPNLVTVRVPSDGRVCFLTSARTHLVVDLVGGYTSSSDVGFLTGEQPFRVFDTRHGGGAPLQAASDYDFDLGTDSLRAVAWNLTATQPAAPGFVTIYPCDIPRPTTSNVNYSVPGETVANFSIIQPDQSGIVCIWSLAATHLIADEAGYYAGPFGLEVFYEGAPTEAAALTDRTASAAPAALAH